MATQIQIRRDTGGNWYGNNTVLASGELAYETDYKRLKIGDGTTSYNSIDYIHDPTVTVYLEKKQGQINFEFKFLLLQMFTVI